jgi:tripartite-type tricarboxylate transporter receptor subunit TctC
MSMLPRLAVLRLALLLPALAGAASVLAQADPAASYPQQTVRILVPFAPGGGTDTTARLLAQKLGDKWGRQVIVENRPGGNTVIATQAVAKAAPDGLTLLLANSTFAINPILSTSLPYDTWKDFVPITTVAGGPFLLVVHPSVPADNLKGMLQVLHAAKPGEWNFATVGGSGIGRIVGELFALQSGTKLQHVPYKGASQVTTDLLAGTVKLTIDPPNTYITHIKGGKLKGLAVTGKNRLALAARRADLRGAGHARIRRAHLVRPVRAGRHAEGRRSTRSPQPSTRSSRSPEMKQNLAGLELDTLPSNPEQFQAYLRAETEKFTRVVKAANIKAAD